MIEAVRVDLLVLLLLLLFFSKKDFESKVIEKLDKISITVSLAVAVMKKAHICSGVIILIFSLVFVFLFVEQVSAAFVQLIEVRPSFLQVASYSLSL